MSVDNVTSSVQVRGQHTSGRRAVGSHHRPLDRARVGQEVSLSIIGKIADGRFLASSGDARYVVDSALPFVVGQTIKATVSGVGGIVELKYLGDGQFQALDAKSDSMLQQSGPRAPFLKNLESQYKRSLSDADHALVAAIASQVADPESVGVGALYLDKLGAAIEHDSLHALYAQQSWSDSGTPSPIVATDISAAVAGAQQGRAEDVATLAKTLGDIAEQSSDVSPGAKGAAQRDLSSLIGDTQPRSQYWTSHHDTRDADDAALAELAHRLLNAQDSRATAHHYGSLPVLINNELVELDLLMFHERQSPAHTQGMRKLVMTLKTDTLGRVEIVAQSSENTLSVSIASQSPHVTERLAAQAQEVRDLVARLGWNVDSVAYRLTTTPIRAAEQLARHVLASGTLDAVV